MKLTKKRLRRIRMAIFFKYDFFRSLYGRPAHIWGFVALLVLLLGATSIWVAHHTLFSNWAGDKAGIVDNVAATFIQVTFIFFLVIAFVILKIGTEGEVKRVNLNIDSSLAQKISFKDTKVSINIDASWYVESEFIRCLQRWLPVKKDEYFLVEAGPLDLPKLTLKKIESLAGHVTLHLGSASYFDIFFTHYCPDLELSKEAYQENTAETLTLRNTVGKSIRGYYDSEINKFSTIKKNTFELSQLLPNALGVSGVLLVRFTGCQTPYLLMAKRGADNIGSRGQLDWGFSGLIESLPWIHRKKITIEQFAMTELEDEVLSQVTILRDLHPHVSALGLVFSERYLSQPELLLLYQFSNVAKEDLDRQLDTTKFQLIALSDAKAEFGRGNVKDICTTGLVFLEEVQSLRTHR